ncbi:hypothetical protein PG993_001156 [Apiospora rasikravindrae]|uniref:Methyltransferase n=1 Tax=Apiospora rasikravindrae TaxID=990691 RepID=A0ABR1UAL7_9PEZI
MESQETPGDAAPPHIEINDGLVTDTDDSAATDHGDLPDLEGGSITSEDGSSDLLSSGAASSQAHELVRSLAEDDDAEETSEYGLPMDLVSLHAPAAFPAYSIYHGARRTFHDDDGDNEDGATLNSTRSIASADIDYVWENGRRYCGEYYMPNDPAEQERLLLLHTVYMGMFDGELTSAPLDNPTHILDVGAGTGEWVEDMADLYKDCEVTGTDIANVFPKSVHPNVFFEIDDAEMHWERPNDHYDLVHFRNMTGAFRDWSAVYEQAFRVTKPGGWIEVLDLNEYEGFGNFFSNFEPASVIHRAARDVLQGSLLSGRPRNISHLEPRLLYDAGFVDIRVTDHALPLSPREMSTGYLCLHSVAEGIEPTSMRLLTRYMGWTPEEVRRVSEAIRSEMLSIIYNYEKAKGFIIKIRVITARKPETTPRPSPWAAAPGSQTLEVDEEVQPIE